MGGLLSAKVIECSWPLTGGNPVGRSNTASNFCKVGCRKFGTVGCISRDISIRLSSTNTPTSSRLMVLIMAFKETSERPKDGSPVRVTCGHRPGISSLVFSSWSGLFPASRAIECLELYQHYPDLKVENHQLCPTLVLEDVLPNIPLLP